MVKTARESVMQIVHNRSFPKNVDDHFQELLSEDGLRFENQEGVYWDLKDEFPYATTDDYYGGILRLICAFYNTYGGLIFFGIHDKKRTPGHNKVKINIEIFNADLRSKLTQPVECIHKNWTLPAYRNEKSEASKKRGASKKSRASKKRKSSKVHDADTELEIDNMVGAVEVILVPKRPTGIVPVRFNVKIGNYPKGRVYLRQAHEVLEVQSKDLSFIYGNRPQSEELISTDEYLDEIPNCLPRSPSTVKEFVGRTEVLDRLWTWVTSDEEPRTFLYGKGGSGKSTIAYQFAKILSENGSQLTTSNGRSIDHILYFSAKTRDLVTLTGTIESSIHVDFSDSTELFRLILFYTEWEELETIESYNDDALINNMRELFNTYNVLLIIDDIDTLTTKNIDPGMDTIYKLLIRSQSGAKVLYTLRNAPSQSLLNSIEVPGLEPNNEYPEFIEKCCNQFKQPLPPKQLQDGELAKLSERRPLVVETIIALRRSSGSYDNAMNLFRNEAGDNARSYLFDREYNALPSDNKARLLLAALSLFHKPVAFGDLESVLNFNPEQLKDAISNVTEMFLETALEKKSSETQYSLGQVTQSYLESQREKLDFYTTLKATVEHFKMGMHPRLPEIARIRSVVEKYIRQQRPEAALTALQDSHIPPKVKQHPEFQMLTGIVLAKQNNIRQDSLREAFKYCVDMGYEDIVGMRQWYFVERTSGLGLVEALGVCEHVINGKQYTPKEKVEFWGKKGFIYQLIARSQLTGDLERAFENYRFALRCCLIAYDRALDLPYFSLAKSKDWARVCCSSYIDHSIKAGFEREIFDFFQNFSERADVRCDPVFLPLSNLLRVLHRKSDIKSLDRHKGLCYRFLEHVSGKRAINFDDSKLKQSLITEINDSIARIDERSKGLPRQ